MKYAKIGPRLAIQNIIDTELSLNADVTGLQSLTDEQAECVATIRADKKIPIFWDSRVTTRETETGTGFKFRWNEVTKTFTKTAIVRPVPYSIAAWQAKAGLALTPHLQAGTMLDAAEASINAMPDGAEKIVVQSAWTNNAKFERTSPTILSFGAALGMTSDDLDNLFRLGGSLTV